jgi:hypothetical protein
MTRVLRSNFESCANFGAFEIYAFVHVRNGCQAKQHLFGDIESQARSDYYIQNRNKTTKYLHIYNILQHGSTFGPTGPSKAGYENL